MQLQTNNIKKELKLHGSLDFPVLVSYECLSAYEGGSFLWHWHPEIEITLVLKGEMHYLVNDMSYHLKTGDGLFCNRNALHSAEMICQQDCEYLSLTFHPKIIYGFEGSLLHAQFISPILEQESFCSLHIPANQPRYHTLLSALSQINQIASAPETPGAELALQIQISTIWLSLYQVFLSAPQTSSIKNTDIMRLKIILAFIQENYREKITLEEIASSVHICKSECCRFFKRHMKMTLFDYLLSYRVQKSLVFLENPNISITEIAANCGFSDACYYAKVFKKYVGCSPKKFRTGK
ncbi:AraC family transcriptional regulator [Lachnospiraceae bacterium OttesenSCG-928-D06]|nr:AraC family transcriptional regulator [Lachnospiraceae bacterium OttesenSCG-928-D06]